MNTEERLKNVEAMVEAMQRSIQDLEVQVCEIEAGEHKTNTDLLMLSNQLVQMAITGMIEMSRALSERECQARCPVTQIELAERLRLIAFEEGASAEARMSKIETLVGDYLNGTL